jgi:tetratricopeptide (TPR) repeat protein
MSEVTLREYCEEIEDLIEQGSLDRAISYCQHILKTYPKHLQVYSLMGKLALEKGELEAAADLFSRALSMDPEDFIARVGMSIANDRDGTLEQAVWHMERAFELAPDNQAIVGELRRLYGRRDGVQPDQVPLTQGALARLHSRGNLYTQAINEFRGLLKMEPERVDLQVALAETLWRADQRIEAAETSLAILEKLPYCLKANLILGEIWSSSGREEEGAAHLKRAQMTDPENETAQALFDERSPLRPIQVRIERLEYAPPPPPTEQEPDWLAAIVQEGTSPAATDEAVPDWLQAVAAAADIEAMPQEDVTTPESDHVPDWLQEVTATAEVDVEGIAVEPEITAPPPTESEMPDWLAALTAEPADAVVEPLAPEEIPGWLEEAVPPAAEEPEAAPGDVPDSPALHAGASGLAEMAPAEAAPPVAEEPEAALGDVPDSPALRAGASGLAEMAPTEAAPPVAEEPEAAPGGVPDWLAEMAPAEAAPPVAGEPEEGADLARADIPDWLAEMAPSQAASQAIPELDLPPADVPDWLTEAVTSEAEPSVEEPVEDVGEIATPPLVAAETPDWLADLVEAAESSMEEPPAEQPAELEEGEVPDWLAALRDEQAPAPTGAESEVTEAELMARLEGMSPEEAFATWEATLAKGEAEEAAAPAAEALRPEELEAAGPIVIEEPEKERLVYPGGAGGEVTEAEAELMARLEDMSPEEALAAWEAMLAEGEEAVAPPVEALQPEEPKAAGPIVIEEPEKERLVYPEGAGGEVTEAEAELMAHLEDMSPEEAFAAWEAMLTEGEEAVAPAVEALQPEEPKAAGPIVIEEPEKERLVYPEGAGGEVTEAEAELMAHLEDMSPEEAFAAWEAMLAEGEAEGQVLEERAPSVEPVAELDQAWVALVEDEGLVAEAPEPGVADVEPATLPEAVAEAEHSWVTLTEDEGLGEVAAPVAAEEAPPTAPAAELDQAWMTLSEDEEGAAEIIAPVLAEDVLPGILATELEQAWVPPVAPEEVAAPAPAEDVLPAEAEPAAEWDQAWMALTEDEGPAEAIAPVVAEEAPPFEPPTVEEIAPELPAWAVAEAAETILEVVPGVEEEMATGPDWVWLAEEDEAEIRTFEPEPVAPPEPPTRPTWITLDEEPAAEAPVAVAPAVDEGVADRAAWREDTDEVRLERARSLWAAGQKGQARIEYERLIRSSLRDDVIADLENITTDEPPEALMLRLLGDAYMRDNRLQNALDTYRRALASL